MKPRKSNEVITTQNLIEVVAYVNRTYPKVKVDLNPCPTNYVKEYYKFQINLILDFGKEPLVVKVQEQVGKFSCFSGKPFPGLQKRGNKPKGHAYTLNNTCSTVGDVCKEIDEYYSLYVSSF